MISVHPAIDAVANACGRLRPELEAEAVERWTIAPPEKHYVPPACCLPGQIERISGVDFGSRDEVVHSLRGGFDALQPATMGYRLRSIDLVDGVLYGRAAARHLRQRRRRLPAYLRPSEVASGALYESWIGNRWFGNWLIDDCLSYRLAERHGVPMTTAPRQLGHVAQYERLLDVGPVHIDDVHFDELILFQDLAQNSDKQARADDLRDRLTTGLAADPHPGVFLLRGSHGQRRILRNEMALAETLNRERGFTVIDPMKSSVSELAQACAGARVVAGIEGSHLVHGLVAMPRDAILLAIQPPDRVLSVLKMTTDRQGQTFAFVVGEGSVDGFTASRDEIDRTLDMALG